MFRVRKSVSKGIVLLLALALILAACAKGAGNTNSASPASSTAPDSAAPNSAAPVTTAPAEELKPVKLIYYIVGSAQPDLQLVNDEVNKITQAKINATIDIRLIDYGAYDQKMNLIISSGEPYDLAFTSSWTNNYNQNVAKGALLPLDDLLDKYAPITKAGVEERIWNAAKVKGKIYGVENNQIMATGYGFQVHKEYTDKYNFDFAAVKKLSDLEPLLKAAKEGSPEVPTVLYNSSNNPFLNSAPIFNMDQIGDRSSPGWIRITDPDLKVVNQYETPEFKEFVQMMRKWYLAGYLRKDAATTKEVDFNKYVIDPFYTLFSSDPDQLKPSNTSPVVNYGLYTKGFINTDRSTATLTGISATSKNPERAMMFIELLNSDKELFNLLAWGIEGKHYTKADSTKKNNYGTPYDIDYMEKSGYHPLTAWEFGNNANLLISQTDAPVKAWQDANKYAKVSPMLGFTFDASSVQSEVAKSTAVVGEFLASLTSGSVDPDKYLPQFLDKLKTAGADLIIAEKQKQIDAWKAAK